MKRNKKITIYLYIAVAISVIISLSLVRAYKFNILSKAQKTLSGCDVNLLNSKSSDMGDCFYSLGGGRLSNEVASLADSFSSQARILCHPNTTDNGYDYFLQTNRYSVRKTNQHCIDQAITDLFPAYTAVSLLQVASSTNAYDNFQCVGFVQTIISGIYGKPLDRGGDARDFIHNVPSDYRYVAKTDNQARIEIGDIALWDDGIYGHIAIVLERMDESDLNYRFRVAEANYQHPGYINNNRWESSDFPAFRGWLHKI